jgi:hypothetical protein
LRCARRTGSTASLARFASRANPHVRAIASASLAWQILRLGSQLGSLRALLAEGSPRRA